MARTDHERALHRANMQKYRASMYTSYNERINVMIQVVPKLLGHAGFTGDVEIDMARSWFKHGIVYRISGPGVDPGGRAAGGYRHVDHAREP